MKNFIKVVASTSLVLMMALLLRVPLTQAAGSPAFNNLPDDAEFLSGCKVDTNGACPTFTDPVHANANDEVAVAVYYHNAVADSVAKNVKIKISLPTDNSTSHTVSGVLSADNANATSGTIANGQEIGAPNLTINSDANTTVQFVSGSLRWYPNRMATNGAGSNLPAGQNGDSIISNGITIGDLQGCFQYSGYVIFKVKLIGQTVVTNNTNLKIVKEVRKAGSTDAFVNSLNVNPGTQVEYRITVTNSDGALTATHTMVQDFLPSGVTATGTAKLIDSAGNSRDLGSVPSSTALDIGDIKPSDHVYVQFTANTDATVTTNNLCVVNKAIANASNAAGAVQATASVCYLVIASPTPTPVTPTPVAPTPTPIKELPHTGPSDVITLFAAGVSGSGVVAGRFYQLKNRLRKQWRNLDVV